MGPVIDIAAADHVQEQWLDLMMKGGKPLRRLDRPFEERPYLTPALIDVTDVKDRPDEEIFGPVLQLIRVKDFDAAIDEANNTRFGLAASLIGGNPELYDKFWANVRAGVINWNKPTNGAPSNAPFGGVGLSGNHRPSAFYAADYCAYPVTSSEAETARARDRRGPPRPQHAGRLRPPGMVEAKRIAFSLTVPEVTATFSRLVPLSMDKGGTVTVCQPPPACTGTSTGSPSLTDRDRLAAASAATIRVAVRGPASEASSVYCIHSPRSNAVT